MIIKLKVKNLTRCVNSDGLGYVWFMVETYFWVHRFTPKKLYRCALNVLLQLLKYKSNMHLLFLSISHQLSQQVVGFNLLNFLIISILNHCVVCNLFLFCVFRNLPRHQFGNLQSKMFPAYFSMVGICCAVSAASFGYLRPWKSSSTTERYQLGFLLSAFAFNLSNLFVFTPMTIEVNFHPGY